MTDLSWHTVVGNEQQVSPTGHFGGNIKLSSYEIKLLTNERIKGVFFKYFVLPGRILVGTSSRLKFKTENHVI